MISRLVHSYPKTGRTWLRVMLAAALTHAARIATEVDLQNVYSIIPNDVAAHGRGAAGFAHAGRIPLVLMSHRSVIDRTAATVLLLREPRDVVVSHWLHARHHYATDVGDLLSFVDGPLGIRHYAAFLEEVAASATPSTLIRYEQLHADPNATLARTASALLLDLGPADITHGVAAGGFQRMQRMELERGMANHDYDRSNPEARRVRRGVVGGHADYMGAAERARVDAVVAKLSPAARALITTHVHA